MKRILLTLTLMVMMVVNASAISYEVACERALFLTDKMAYELELSAEQYEAVYEINLDYLLSLSDRASLYGSAWTRRNTVLATVLAAWQLATYRSVDYFYRPVTWRNNKWYYDVYNYYSHTKYFRVRPSAYKTYRGGKKADQYKGKSFNAPKQSKRSQNERNLQIQNRKLIQQNRSLMDKNKSLQQQQGTGKNNVKGNSRNNSKQSNKANTQNSKAGKQNSKVNTQSSKTNKQSSKASNQNRR